MTEDDWWELLQKSPRPWMLIELPKVDWLLYRAAANWWAERGRDDNAAYFRSRSRLGIEMRVSKDGHVKYMAFGDRPHGAKERGEIR